MNLVRSLLRPILPLLALAQLASAQPAPVPVVVMPAATGGAATPLPSPEPFFRNPDHGDVRLSPSGGFLALSVPIERRMRLAVMDLKTRTTKIVASVAGQNFDSFSWVNDRRIVFSVADFETGSGEWRGGGLFAVDRDGSDFVELAPTVSKARSAPPFRYYHTAPLAMLASVSPLANAKRIRAPVLMAYGSQDRRVPIVHGTKMRDALPLETMVEWVVYAHEGHGFMLEENRFDFQRRVARFLATNLAPR
jgi:pimeloyl-ACP methyl ester carboxylesterase